MISHDEVGVFHNVPNKAIQKWQHVRSTRYTIFLMLNDALCHEAGLPHNYCILQMIQMDPTGVRLNGTGGFTPFLYISVIYLLFICL